MSGPADRRLGPPERRVPGSTARRTRSTPACCPWTAEVAQTGRLLVGGVDVVDLAEEHGTPLFVYDEAHLRARCREAVAAWGDGVAYATKAFLCMAMARLALEEGMCLDVSTGGELHVALSAGVPPDRLVLHGNNKSDDELADCRLPRASAASSSTPSTRSTVSSGCCPGAAAGPVETPGLRSGAPAPCWSGSRRASRRTPTSSSDRTGGLEVRVRAGRRARRRRAVERLVARAAGAVDLVGIHAHIGSQVFALAPFAQEVEVLAGFFAPLGLPELWSAAVSASPTWTGDGAVDAAVGRLGARGLPPGRDRRAAVSPPSRDGRSWPSAAMTLYRVGTIKTCPGTAPMSSVDGGMSDNPRPVLYGSGYEAFLPRRRGPPPPAGPARGQALRVR